MSFRGIIEWVKWFVSEGTPAKPERYSQEEYDAVSEDLRRRFPRAGDYAYGANGR